MFDWKFSKNTQGFLNKRYIVIIFIVIVILLATAYLLVYKTKQNPKSVVETPILGKAPQPVHDITITVTSAGFSPKTVTAKSGNRIIWLNQTAGKVSVNSNDYPTNKLYPFLNLGMFDRGSSVTLILTKSGTFTYHNQFNPSQTGTLVVK